MVLFTEKALFADSDEIEKVTSPPKEDSRFAMIEDLPGYSENSTVIRREFPVESLLHAQVRAMQTNTIILVFMISRFV